MATHSSNSCLENPMGGGTWWAAVHGVAKSRTWLSDFTFTFHFHALKKEMATHSSVLAWRIPRTGEPDGLPSMGSHRVRTEGAVWWRAFCSFFFFCFALLCFAYLGTGIFTVLGGDQWCLSRTVKHETVWKQEWTEHSGFWSRGPRC